MPFLDYLPFIGSVLNGVGSLFQQKKENDSNLALAKYQNEANIALWERNNEYNTPLNQRNRAIEAGYNPNLFYGQGNLGNSSMPSPAQRAEVKRSMPDIVNGIVNSVQLVNQRKQLNMEQAKTNAIVDNYKARNEMLRLQGITEIAKQAGVKSMNGIKEIQKRFLEHSYDFRMRSAASQAELLYEQVRRNVIVNDNLPTQIKQNIEYNAQKISKVISDLKMNGVKIGNLLTQRSVMRQTIANMQSQMKLTKAQAYKTYVDAANVILHGKLDRAKFNMTPYGAGMLGQTYGILTTTLMSVEDELKGVDTSDGIGLDFYNIDQFSDFPSMDDLDL